MVKFFKVTLIGFFVLSIHVLWADSCFCLKESSLELGLSYRRDNIKWRTRENRVSDFLSKAKWDGLVIGQVEAELKFLTKDHLYGRFNADCGKILEGNVHLTNFLGRNGDGQERFSTLSSTANRGHVYDLSAALGYEFVWCNEAIKIFPLLGFSYHRQQLSLIDTDVSPSFFTPGLVNHSKKEDAFYKTRWYGPWVGLDFIYRIGWNISLLLKYEHHWALFRASSPWDLEGLLSEQTQIPLRFSQEAHARADLIQGTIQYSYCDWFFSISCRYQVWRTRLGTQDVHLKEVDLTHVEDHEPLARVHWNSFAFLTSVGYLF